MKRLTIALSFLLFAAAGCGDQPSDGPLLSESGPDTAAAAPAAELEVTCTENATAVSATTVEAGPQGVVVRVVDKTALNLRVFLVNPAAAGRYVGGAQAGVNGVGGFAEVHPGRVFVRCVDLETPEHSEQVEQSDEAREIDVEATEGVWRSPQPLSCSGATTQMIRDFVASDPGQPSRPGAENAETAVRHDLGIAPLLERNDELTTTGYRDTDRPTVQVRRNGTTVLTASTERGPAGWFVTGFGACSPLPAPSGN